MEIYTYTPNVQKNKKTLLCNYKHIMIKTIIYFKLHKHL